MSLFEKLVHCLKDLEDSKVNVKKSLILAEEVLTLVFIIKENAEALTEEEKRELREKVDANIELIQICIDCTACHFYTRLDDNVLRLHSALEFLIDDCRVLGLEECYETLTEIIERFDGDDHPDTNRAVSSQKAEMTNSSTKGSRTLASLSRMAGAI